MNPLNFINYLGNNIVIVKNAPLVADPTDGTLYRDWDAADTTTVAGCMFQPFQPAGTKLLEDNKFREYSSGFFRLWMPAGSPVDSNSKIEFNGHTYEVYGSPNPWYDFEGVESHIECLLYERLG